MDYKVNRKILKKKKNLIFVKSYTKNLTFVCQL